MSLWYLAAPYSHPDPAVREWRFEQATRVAAALLRRGQLVLSPLTQSHPLARWGLPGDWPFWERLDRRLLAGCDELVVLQLPGWRESRGVRAEIELAREWDLPIHYWSPETISNVSGGDTNMSVRPLSQETSI